MAGTEPLTIDALDCGRARRLEGVAIGVAAVIFVGVGVGMAVDAGALGELLASLARWW